MPIIRANPAARLHAIFFHVLSFITSSSIKPGRRVEFGLDPPFPGMAASVRSVSRGVDALAVNCRSFAGQSDKDLISELLTLPLLHARGSRSAHLEVRRSV